ncbi:MAG TPA: 4'-phosphopantetheinyl transferase superfamily protein [Drouetiella sp.]
MKDPAVSTADQSKSEARSSASDAGLHVVFTDPKQLDCSYPPTDVIELWCGKLAASETNLKVFSSLLNDAELERAARFKRNADGEKFKIARGTLRCILGAALKVNPETIEFETGKFGKPTLKDFPALHFNLSHCDRYMLIALSSDAPVGVDVEQHNRTTNVDAIARKHFSESENLLLQEKTGQTRLHLFFDIWTKKEAVVKSLGTGISQALTDLPPEEQLTEQGWYVQGLDTDTLYGITDEEASASAALAIQVTGRIPSIQTRRWDWT